MKILHVVGAMNRGGAESRIMDIFRSINRSEFQFSFLVYNTDLCQYRDEILKLGGSFEVIPSPNSGLYRYLKSMYRVLTSDYDIVHVHVGVGGGVPLLISFLARIRVRIFHARNTFGAKTKGTRRKIYDRVSLFLIKHFSNMKLAVSQKSAESYFGKGCVSRGVVQIIPNTIDEAKFLDNGRYRSELRSEFNIEQRAIVIGHVGSFRKEKNHSFLLRMFRELLKIQSNVYLVLVGDGSLRCEIENQIKELHLDDNVILTGLRSDIDRIYSMFDVFVFPSISEGLPGSVLEAQASGLRCILSDTIDKSVDIGASLVSFLSLSKSEMEWASATMNVLRCSDYILTPNEIEHCFISSGYSISELIKKLSIIYNSSK